MKTAVLQPGYLVSLKTSLRGGVNYQRVDIEADHTTESGARVARWETKRRIDDPAEFKAASEARSKARAAVAAVCSSSTFGLLCPIKRADDLQTAIAAARDIAAAHNRASARTQVDVFVLVGRIAQDDVEAARAIASEVRELLDAMQAGIKAADPEAIRDAANKARALGQMLTPEVGEKVSAAIAEARAAAREITKRVAKSGEAAAAVIAELTTRNIDAARFSFLDMDEGAAAAPTEPGARGVDLPPEAPAPETAPEEPSTTAPAADARPLELDTTETEAPAQQAAPAAPVRNMELF